MSRRLIIVRTTIVTLILILLTLLAAEVVLTVTDPFGLHYFDDLWLFRTTLNDDPSGYAMPPGRVQLARSAYTINSDGSRQVPDSVSNAPVVTFAGDSLTFGWGVNDGETWVNILAHEIGLNAINIGRNAYSSTNVLMLVESRDPDCTVFLTIVNDKDDMPYYPLLEAPTRPWKAYIDRYQGYARFRSSPSAEVADDVPAFDRAMRTMRERPNTLMIAFDAPYGREVAEMYGVTLIEPYTNEISWADGHPNPMGHREIADAMIPVVSAWLDEVGRENCRR